MPDKEHPLPRPRHATIRALQDSDAPPPRFPIENTSFSDHVLLQVMMIGSVLVSRLRQFAPSSNPILARLNVRRELDRLRSFCGNWPSGYDVSAAARVGFFSLGWEDNIQCFSCGYVLQNWDFPHNPTLLHMRLQPPCAMALGFEIRNVPATSGWSSIPRMLASYQLPDNHSNVGNAQGSTARTNNRNEVLHPRPFGTASPSATMTSASMRILQHRMQALRNGDFTRTSPQSTTRDNDRSSLDPLSQQQSPEPVHSINPLFPDFNRLMLNVPGENVPTTFAIGQEPVDLSAAVFNRDENEESSEDSEQVQLEVAMQREVATCVMKFLVREALRQNIEKNGTVGQSATALVEAVQDLQRLRDESQLQLERQQEIQRPNLVNGKLPESLPDGDAGYDTFQSTLNVSSVLSSEGADSSSVDDPPHLLQTSDLTDTALESTSSSSDETAARTSEDSVPILPEEEE